MALREHLQSLIRIKSMQERRAVKKAREKDLKERMVSARGKWGVGGRGVRVVPIPHGTSNRGAGEGVTCKPLFWCVRPDQRGPRQRERAPHLVLTNEQVDRFGEFWKSIWEVPAEHNPEHPALEEWRVAAREQTRVSPDNTPTRRGKRPWPRWRDGRPRAPTG